MDRERRFGIAGRVIRVGFWANLLLMALKLLAGHFGDSGAVFADGLESAADLLVLSATMVALRIGRKPVDDDHPYGHGKAESVAATLVSLVIFATGGAILYDAATTIAGRGYGTPRLIAVAAVVITIAIKEALYRYTRRVSERLQSPALDAVARDHRKDALTSLLTLAGVAGAYLGAAVLDPLAAVAIALLIFRIAWVTFRSAANDLMDARPAGEATAAVAALANAVTGVKRVHEIRSRRSGQYLIIDLTLEMDPEMTVRESHEITDAVKRRIFERFPGVGDVMIHIDPFDEAHEELSRL